MESQARMLKDICSYLAGQDGQLEKEVIPFLHIKHGYTPEDFENAGICTKQEAEQYISDYEE